MIDSIARDIYYTNPFQKDEFGKYDWNTIFTRYNARKEKTLYDAEVLVQP